MGAVGGGLSHSRPWVAPLANQRVRSKLVCEKARWPLSFPRRSLSIQEGCRSFFHLSSFFHPPFPFSLFDTRSPPCVTVVGFAFNNNFFPLPLCFSFLSELGSRFIFFSRDFCRSLYPLDTLLVQSYIHIRHVASIRPQRGKAVRCLDHRLLPPSRLHCASGVFRNRPCPGR